MGNTRICPILLFLFCVGSKANYEGHIVVNIRPQTDLQIEFAMQLEQLHYELDVFGQTSDGVVVRVPPESQSTFFSDLDSYGIEFEITETNLQTVINDAQQKNDEARRRHEDLGSSYNFTYYLTMDELYAWQDEVASGCSFCSVVDIGSSFEGRPIRVFQAEKSGSNSGKRKIWIDSGIHAREWIAFSTGAYFMQQVAEDTDPIMTSILDTYDVYLLTAVNPDGYAFTWGEVGRMWRKTRSTQPGVVCTGVDANRNFDFMWMTIGASDDPCDNTYAGPAPFSESEAQAMADFIMADNQYDVFMTLHTYGQLWMSPFGYTTELPSDYDELMRVANAGADKLTSVYGTEYTVGAASQILYSSSGTSRDWARGGLDQNVIKGAQIPYVFTLELRDTSSFVLPPDQILPTGVETWAGFKAMMDAIMNP